MKQFYAVLAFVLLLTTSTTSFAQLARQWVAHFTGDLKGGANSASAMAVDNAGNIIVTGTVSGKLTGNDIVTLKYSSDGELLWSKRYNFGAGSRDDRGKAIAVDTGNNIYVTGSSDGGSGSQSDIVTIKYLPNGDTAWTRRYDGPGHSDDRPVAIAVNDSLNVFVAGSSIGSGTGYDFVALKYDSSGNLEWAQRYDGPASSTDLAVGMALRGNADLYVCGSSIDTTNDYTLVRYDAGSGNFRWASRYKGPGQDYASAMVLRGAPDLYVTGSSDNGAGNINMVTVQFDSSGAQQWVSVYDGPDSSTDIGTSVSVSGSAGNARVYVTGKSIGTGSFYDIVTLRLNPNDGTVNWEDRYNGGGNDDDEPVGMVGSGNPLVLGTSINSGVGLDYTVLEYSTGGNLQFALTYNNASFNGDDAPADILTDGGGTYVTGTSRKSKGSEILTIKYFNPQHLKYRSFLPESLMVKGNSIATPGVPANYGNVRDTAFARAFPKLKAGFPGAPGGLLLGMARSDSAGAYGWMRFTKGANILKFLPQTGAARGFDLYAGGAFKGEKKDPTLTKFSDHLAGELLALKLAIGASDAGVTPPTFGDLTYQNHDTINGVALDNMSLRAIALFTDNMLTYWRNYPPVAWDTLDSVITHINNAFNGRLAITGTGPLVATGAVSIDSTTLLSPSAAPLLNPLAFPPGSLDAQPEKYALYQNYPNPFNPATTIDFDLPQAGAVTLKVYDLLGREVATLADGEKMDEGRQTVTFVPDRLASGVYFYRLTVDDGRFRQMRKMVLLK